MQLRRSVLVLVSIVVGCVALRASAATPPMARVYRLSERSTYQTGCFPPCLCPVLNETALRGTFTLAPAGTDGLFDVFTVSEVSWISQAPDGREVRVTGSGTYRIGGEFALEQQLELDLVVDGTAAHFDSGLVAAGGAQFPAIHVSVSQHQMFCHDTVLAIDAAPLPMSRMARYRVVAPSTFQQGCVDPCKCPEGPTLPLRATFRLVPLLSGPLFEEFAVVDLRGLIADGVSRRIVRVRGAGRYRVGGEVVIEQQLTLDLSLDGQPSLHLDSGLVAGGGVFPRRVDVSASSGGQCFVTRVDLHAQRMPPRPAPRIRP